MTSGGFSFGVPVADAAVSSILRPSAFEPSVFSVGTLDKKPKKKEDCDVTQGTSLMKLSTPWREVEWTEDAREGLVRRLCSYAPCCRDVAQARVLLLGPVGSGKSSFISSVQSVLDGRVTNRAMVGGGACSFTHQLQSFPLRGSESCAVELWDSMGFGDLSGPSLHHLLGVVRGHAPHGYKSTPVIHRLRPALTGIRPGPLQTDLSLDLSE
uniref:Interferon-induced protein 44-like n=1 Tax=Knipowitschia caucasica TaxID=637954 RepID=A0AAV2KTR5_KNICA